MIESMIEPNERNLYDGTVRDGGSWFIVDVGEDPEHYDVWIGSDREKDYYMPIQRDIFRKSLIVSPVNMVGHDLQYLTSGGANRIMEEHGIPYEELVLALSRARINELNAEVRVLSEQARTAVEA